MGAPGWQELNPLEVLEVCKEWQSGGWGGVGWVQRAVRLSSPGSLQVPGSDRKSRCNRSGKALSMSSPGVPKCPLVV